MLEKGNDSKIKKGDQVAVIYSGMLFDGSIFESTTREKPYKLKAGEGEAVEGFDTGIAALGFGDKARLFIPAHLAYGANGAGEKVPPFSNLIFEVEVFKP